MRKYLYRMAFVVGVLLLLTGNVWAGDTYYFKVNSVTPSSTPVFEATAGKTISLNFTVRIGVLVSSDDAGEEIDGYYKGASALSWNVSETELFTESSSKYSLVGGTLSDLPSNCVVITLSEGTKTGIIDVKVVITGTLTTATEELTVNAFMASADDSGNLTQKGETKSGTITLTTDSTPTEEDFADANSKYWNGLNPPFGKKGGSDKSKPKLVTTKPRAFNAGVMDERDIRIQGSSPLVNVYIAGRDAVKLFNLDKSMKNTNIELTQDNIKKYGIPFRVTSYDITSADGKSVTSIVTIAYSGANVSYKSYPVTFALENNNTRKPIAKAVKIDVIPLVSPYWMAEGASTDKVDTYGDPLYSTTKTTTSEDEFNADVENYEVSDVVRTSIDVISEDDQGNYAVVSTDESIIYISGELSTASKDAGFTYLYVSGDQITYTVDYTTTDYVNVGTSKTITVSVPLKTTNGTVTPVTFKVGSKSGPYFITGKPDPDRVKNGLTYTLTQPKYNGKGEISQDGQVTISGKLLRVDKETKTPITFTATNPSTKAKATLKVNVIGKVAPYFDEKKVDKGYITGTKETTAGKVPSVKVKAKGSKTIYYDIPYSADLAALTALRLSFDAKKGAMIALNKGKNVKVVGFTAFDQFADCGRTIQWKKQECDKKKVIWAPHYSITDKGPIHHGSFLEIYDTMLEMARQFQTDIQFAFKPHPRLLSELYEYPVWGKERTDNYYRCWKDGNNTQLVTGDYVDLFLSSDAMIHDSVSFMAEYHFSHQPALYITGDVQQTKRQLNELGNRAIDAHYLGKQKSEIISFLENVVLRGEDPLRNKRLAFYNDYLIPPGGKSVAEIIYEDLIESLKLNG